MQEEYPSITMTLVMETLEEIVPEDQRDLLTAFRECIKLLENEGIYAQFLANW